MNAQAVRERGDALRESNVILGLLNSIQWAEFNLHCMKKGI